MTVSAATANHRIADMLDMYEGSTEFSQERHKQCADNWSKALNTLNDALTAFANDAIRLQEYIDGKN
jgi:hypothetical protein